MSDDPIHPDANSAFDRVVHGVAREDLEALGEGEVRARFNSGGYGHRNTHPFEFVSAWLSGKEFERIEESLAIARDAASSAKAAAAAATASALSAAAATTLARQAKTISITFAVISTIVSIIALVLKK